jgi:hypothetical protein
MACSLLDSLRCSWRHHREGRACNARTRHRAYLIPSNCDRFLTHDFLVDDDDQHHDSSSEGNETAANTRTKGEGDGTRKANGRKTRKDERATTERAGDQRTREEIAKTASYEEGARRSNGITSDSTCGLGGIRVSSIALLPPSYCAIMSAVCRVILSFGWLVCAANRIRY